MGNYNGNGFLSALAVRLIAAFTIIIVILIGIGLGLALAETTNIRNNENFVEFTPALPSRLLCINGTVITEFSADEKRELVPINELPRHLIHAVLAREDPNFFNHRGFCIRGITRAAVGLLVGENRGGGSTITQQVAGTLHTNRAERTLRRKIVELWYALQMERRYTKNEILEIYLNYMPMGPGTFGVETTSRYFFGHSAREVSLAEAAALAVMLSGPGRFNPISNPTQAMNRQRFVLDRMIQFGFTTQEEADASFNEYWDNFDWTRASIAAYFMREDRAPWFSEHVRRELDGMMFGTMNYFRDGFVVHTTLNLHHQDTAERLMTETLERANRNFQAANRRGNLQAERTFMPIVDMLALAFDLTDVRATAAGQAEARAISSYNRNINPIVDMAALVFGIPELRDMTARSFAQQQRIAEQNVIEGALISIENETGHITALIGGSQFDETNQFIRATQGSMQPGSAFKTLYFSAAIDSRQFTSASLIHDAPIVFFNDDGTPYIPSNYGGIWRGPVLFYNVHAISLNIPSLIILDTIGFDAAIERSAALKGITNPAEINRIFPRVYPLALGVHSTNPLQMARAFAVLGNQGRAVTPMAIRSIEDRNGRVIFDLERELRQRQRRENIQVVSPQNAYVMTRMMERTVDLGTLRFGTNAGSKFVFRDENGRQFRMPIAAKTGTTQNWADGWVIGYSPYYTTAMWVGFDLPGNSLGAGVSGAVLVGPAWGDFMREIHQGLPHRDFIRPSTGIVDATICADSGLLRTEFCSRVRTFPFLEGTQPVRFCNVHGNESSFATRLPPPMIPMPGMSEALGHIRMPVLQLDLLPELQELLQSDRNQPPGRNQPARNQPAGRNQNQRTPGNNPFLDDDLPQIEPAADPLDLPFVPEDVEVSVPGMLLYVREEEDDDEGEIFDELADMMIDELPSWNPLE